MPSIENNFEKWLACTDINTIPDLDDKTQECQYFFNLLTTQENQPAFRWILSAFLNAAYSFFECSALMMHFRFTTPNGEPEKDDDGISILKEHIKIEQNKKNTSYIKTAGSTELTKKLYDLRRKNTHHHPLTIIKETSNPKGDFMITDLQDNEIHALKFCEDVLQLIVLISGKIHN